MRFGRGGKVILGLAGLLAPRQRCAWRRLSALHELRALRGALSGARHRRLAPSGRHRLGRAETPARGFRLHEGNRRRRPCRHAIRCQLAGGRQCRAGPRCLSLLHLLQARYRPGAQLHAHRRRRQGGDAAGGRSSNSAATASTGRPAPPSWRSSRPTSPRSNGTMASGRSSMSHGLFTRAT